MALHADLPVVGFNDPPRQRQSEPGSSALGGVERTEDIRQILGLNAVACVGDGYNRGLALLKRSDPYQSWTIDRLHRVQKQVEQHLMDLIGVMFHRIEASRRSELNLNPWL